MKIKTGDMIVESGISYIVTKIDGTLWGYSNNAEYEIEIDENFVPDAHFPINKPSCTEIAELKKSLDEYIAFKGVK